VLLLKATRCSGSYWRDQIWFASAHLSEHEEARAAHIQGDLLCATRRPHDHRKAVVGSAHRSDATIVTTFPKGKALRDWLMNNNALVNGELPIQQARHNADVGPANTVSQAWILADQDARPAGATQYFSFNTPTNAGMTPDGPAYCGRVVFSDLHVGGAGNDQPDEPVPSGCEDAELSPQEKALEFMLFDLSSCIVPDDRPPLPPPALN
jgi:hypothetical protein